jgi:rhodanese-related sulfurtransferase
MVKTLIGAILLTGIGIGAGYVHAQLNKQGQNPLITKLPAQQPQQTPAIKPDVPAPAGNQAEPPAPATEAPDTTAKQPDAPAPAGQTPGPTAQAPAAQPPAPAPANPPAAAESDMFISIARAKELYDQKARGQWDGIFIDARPYQDYTAGHIPGSMHIDKKYFDGAVPKKVRDYLPGMPVVIYCHGENCTDSEAVAARLIALKRSIGPIYIIKEGYPGWTKAGYPVDSGGEVGFE